MQNLIFTGNLISNFTVEFIHQNLYLKYTYQSSIGKLQNKYESTITQLCSSEM